MIIRVLLVVCQLVLSAVLLIAALGKLTYPRQFLAALRASGTPKWLIQPMSSLIVVFELELASALTFSTPWSLPLSFVGTFLLLGAFTGWLTSVYQRKLNVQCGCFGASHAHVNKVSILRNLVFLAIAVVGFFLALATQSMLPSFSVWTLFMDVFLAICATLLMLRHHLNGAKAIPAPFIAQGGAKDM